MNESDRDRTREGRREYGGPRDRLGRPLPAGSPDGLADRPDPGKVAGGPDEVFEIGARLFDEQRFWEAHEFFEFVWKHEDGDPADRDFWKGVTQIAVGYCHAQRGNAPGAITLLNRAVGYLDGYPSPHRRVHTRRLMASAIGVASDIEARGDTPGRVFPRFPIVMPSH